MVKFYTSIFILLGKKNEKKKKEKVGKFVKSNIVKLCKIVIIRICVIILYLWIEWELDVMGTPTKDCSLIKILLSIIRVHLKRVCFKC